MRGDAQSEAWAEVARLKGRLEEAEGRVRRLEKDRKYVRSQFESQRRRCAILAAAAEMRAGRVSALASSSMWDKEATVLATMMARWTHTDDLPELCFRALYKLRGMNGKRLSEGLATLPNCGMFEALRKSIREETLLEVNEHLREVFSVEKWNLLRLCSGLSWNVLRWMNDVFMWDVTVTEEGEERHRQTIMQGSNIKLINLVPIAPMRETLDKIVSHQGATRAHDDGRGCEVESLGYTITMAMEQSKDSTMGGLSALGTKDNPILIALTFDGANLTEADSGVRLALSVRADVPPLPLLRPFSPAHALGTRERKIEHCATPLPQLNARPSGSVGGAPQPISTRHAYTGILATWHEEERRALGGKLAYHPCTHQAHMAADVPALRRWWPHA